MCKLFKCYNSESLNNIRPTVHMDDGSDDEDDEDEENDAIKLVENNCGMELRGSGPVLNKNKLVENNPGFLQTEKEEKCSNKNNNPDLLRPLENSTCISGSAGTSSKIVTILDAEPIDTIH